MMGLGIAVCSPSVPLISMRSPGRSGRRIRGCRQSKSHVRDVAASVLAQAGYRVLQARNGAEAVDILHRGLDAGLVLQPGNAQRPTNICMCCGCCCQVLKNLKTLDSPAKVVHTNYYAEVIM